MSNYGDLINIEEFEKRETFSEDRGELSFYCKDCKKLVEAKRPDDKGYTFMCPKCKGTKVVIGTEQGLKSNYKIK
ncbi:hypothetical protein LRZ95_00575 [Candidatus Gracilibacteria bacterium]|nr:hypothetical protein [Candidatus Gracilibacteria bacterium]